MDYLFTIITAVYNCENFIHECVNSIFKQTLGFGENIQLILINDGSLDSSGKICDDYKSIYPNNIKVIHKANGGVSSARNAGLKIAEGKYISFVDSDDKIPNNFCEIVYKYFEKHYYKTDIITVPIYFFDAQQGEHWQNKKFKKGTRIINLQKDYTTSQMFVTSSIFKRSTLENHTFDENLRTGEDLKFVNEILLKKQSIGVLCQTHYLYRIRTGENSLIQTSKHKAAWYEPYLDNIITYFYNLCIQTLGYFPYFIQYTLACDLQWKIKQTDDYKLALDDDALMSYKCNLWNVLGYFDDQIILLLPKLLQEEKIFWLSKKYKRLPAIRHQSDNYMLYFNNTICGWLSQGIVKYEFFKFYKDKILIDGHITLLPFISNNPQLKLFIQCDNRRFQANFVRKTEQATMLDGEQIFIRRYFKAEILLPLINNQTKIQCAVVLSNGCLATKINIQFGEFFPLNKSFNNSYYYKKHYMLTYEKKELIIRKVSKWTVLKQELKYIKELYNFSSDKHKKLFKIRFIANAVAFYKNIFKKEIWIISDKADKADDNGEAFYKYLQNNNKIRSYFIVSKESIDYNRLKQYGKVADYLSYKHKILYLFADKILSAYSHKEFSLPIFTFPNPIKDYINDKKFVFLQHGIIKDDMSASLNKEWKNFDLFVTSTKDEFSSLFEYNYNYRQHEVALTGLPRYDYLKDNKQNIITIAPTWRRYIFDNMDPKTNIWALKKGFKESDYYKFYNKMLNDKELINSAEKLGYKLQFLPHPIFFPHKDCFCADDRIKILGYGVRYNEVYEQSALMITDYSSAVFDFSYLYKPIIYAQFDEKNYDKGYFDYNEDGLGEVCTDYDSTIKKIIEYMENECKLKDFYKARIDSFFYYRDTKNCKRVYDEICKLNND